jgi:hypothetical protein
MSLGVEKGADKWSLRGFGDAGRLAMDIEVVEPIIQVEPRLTWTGFVWNPKPAF